MELWLVRHGDTITEADGLYTPRNGLTPLGIEQACSVAKVLHEVEFDVCYSSALRRAVQTAEIYAEPIGVDFEPIAELNEIEVGNIKDAPVEFKHQVINHHIKLDFAHLGGENGGQFSRRIAGGFQILMNDADAKGVKRALAFLHGGTIAAILDLMAGREFNYQRRPRMPNCAYTVARRSADGKWSEWQGWHSDHLTALT